MLLLRRPRYLERFLRNSVILRGLSQTSGLCDLHKSVYCACANVIAGVHDFGLANSASAAVGAAAAAAFPLQVFQCNLPRCSEV